jgi:NitT/TauT family transport system substrate-binding protein
LRAASLKLADTPVGMDRAPVKRPSSDRLGSLNRRATVRNCKTYLRATALHLSLAAVLTTGLAADAFAQAKKTLLVAEPSHGIGYLPLYITIAKGYFAEEGLEVKPVTMEGGSTHTNAVLTGQAFAFIGGPEHNAFAKVRGGELRAVVNIVNRGNSYITVRKGSEPKPGESLANFFKGKTIATGFYSSTPNSIMRYYLNKFGLDPKVDVKLLEITHGAIIASLRTGNATIASMNEPILTQGIHDGNWGEPIINVPRDLGPYAYSTINVHLNSIKSDRETVAKFVRAVSKGLKFTHDNQQEAAVLARKEFPTMSPEAIKATLDRAFADDLWSEDGMVTPESWTTGQAVVRDAGILKQEVPYDAIIDMQFMRARQSSLR